MGRGGSAQQQQLQVQDPDRPRFHIHPPQGWMNDPNGPVFYKGRYHMFYQHLPNACEWAFGIVWGHAVSSDLVHWEHLPPALVPDPGMLDADGCFSGSCVLDSDGTPVLLYTGVRLRSNEVAGELPPPEHDLGMVWIETQMAAVPEDPDDPLLVRWRKISSPFLHLPPSHLQLTGWRDPFIFTTNTAAAPAEESTGFAANGYSRDIRMLIGSGLKGQGGTALVYKSRSLLEGWELEGTLCEAQNTDTGVVWECPLLVPLDPVPRNLRAPSKEVAPRWLVCSALPSQTKGSSISGAEGEDVGEGDAFGSCDVLQPGSATSHTSRGNGSGSGGRGTIRAVGSHPKLHLGLTAALAAGGAAAAAGSSGSARIPAAVPSAVVSATEEAAAAGGAANGAARGEEDEEGEEDEGDAEAETPVGFAFMKRHERTSSFAFDKDPSIDNLLLTEEAASLAVTAWQQQAASAGGSAVGSPVGSPGAGSAAAALGPLEPALGGSSQRAPADQRQQQQGHARAAEDAPSDATALPPGLRGRAPVAGAKLALESAATLEHWSTHTSEVASPPQPLSSGQPSPAGLASPEKRPQGAPAGPPPPPLPSLAAVSQQAQQHAAQQQRDDEATRHQQQQAEEDRFAAAFSQIRGIRARKRSQERARSAARAAGSALRLSMPSDSDLQLAAAAAAPTASAEGAETEANTPVAPARQWHFFTVSPDAPTNPVLYWMGHVEDREEAKFELETAKGPYRLDLGDVLYAPNVCQDGQGRWLMWGWLQERRKMGSYNYAGCLTLPRELHCTEDGRLVQAPIPELAQLRQGPGWRQDGLKVPSEEAVPLKAAPGAPALDIEVTIDRGTSFAAGLLFRSYEAEAEGGTALIYDWDRNTLEAIFNVPPNWQPQTAAQAAAHALPHSGRFSAGTAGGGEQEPFDPALLLTPRNPGALAAFSRSQSMIFSPEGIGGGAYDSLTASPRTATDSLVGEMSSVGGALQSPQRSGISIAGTPRPPSLDLGIPGLLPPPHLADDLAGSMPTSDHGSFFPAFNQAIPRSLSAIPLGLLGAGASGPGSNTARSGFQPGSLPTGGGLYRSVSDGRAALGGMTRVGSHPTLLSYGSSLPRLGGGLQSPRRSPQPPQPLHADTDADLDFLLDDLAAPMREVPAPVVEPRRVGGPLPLMQGNQPIHLRIVVDHSCVEVYTGTGEVLSTRIYRGQAPEGSTDAGISFISFGGTALVQKCSTWEMGSAWEQASAVVETPQSVKSSATPAAAGSPVQPPSARSVGSPLPATSSTLPAAAAAAAAAALAPAGSERQEEDEGQVERQAEGVQMQRAQASAASAAADAMLDDLVTCFSPQCGAPIAMAAPFAAS